MGKKGQVTIFIIVGIVIVVALVAFFFLKNNFKTNNNSFDASSVKLFVDECIKKVGEEAIVYISLNGGYLQYPEESTSTGVPIYFSNGEADFIKKEKIEESISIYVREKLFFCTRNFVDFSDFEINQDEIEVTSEIKDGGVKFIVDYPLTIKKGENVLRFERFDDVFVECGLNKIHMGIDSFFKESIGNSELCLSCLMKSINYFDLSMNLVDDGNYTVFFVRDGSKINDKNLTFVFAGEFK